MIDLSSKFSVSQERIQQLVENEISHPNYQITIDRANTMNTWYEAEFEDDQVELTDRKEYIIKQSSIESNEDYAAKLRRMRLFPLEAKFLSSQKRIYDENNVDRQYAPNTKPYWQWKENNYDDAGATQTTFYRDKVLFVKEVLGFGAVVLDVMMDDAGNTITDDFKKPVVYPYVVKPHEVFNFEIKQGQLTFVIIKQKFYDDMGQIYTKWTAYTRDFIYVYTQNKGKDLKELQSIIPNAFQEVPVKLLLGDIDSTNSFSVGKPRRYSLKGLYLAASELFYDLQQGSELFGHPIPVYPESMLKAMAGIVEGDEYDSKKIKEKVGMCIAYPDEAPPTGKLFYQADMQGLEHLTAVIFDRLMSLIFNLAMVRDKSVVKSNVSGSAKFLDNVEEQGLLAQTAMDMEDIENEVVRLTCKARKEDCAQFKVTYSKHYDLSSAKEIFSDLIEGLQYKGMTLPLMRYLLKEYLRKRSAPQEIIDEVLTNLDEYGLPKQPQDIKSLEGILPEDELTRLAQPHKKGIETV